MNVCFQDAAAGLNRCGSRDVAPTPEPGTFGLIGVGIPGARAGLPALRPRSQISQLPDPGQMMVVVFGDEE